MGGGAHAERQLETERRRRRQQDEERRKRRKQDEERGVGGKGRQPQNRSEQRMLLLGRRVAQLDHQRQVGQQSEPQLEEGEMRRQKP